MPASGFRIQSPTTSNSSLLNPCIIAAWSIITALPWQGRTVQSCCVYIGTFVALDFLMPNPAALKFVHNQLTKRRMKHSVLLRRCGAYCVVSTCSNRCGRQVYDAKSPTNTTAQRYTWWHHGHEKRPMIYLGCSAWKNCSGCAGMIRSG